MYAYWQDVTKVDTSAQTVTLEPAETIPYTTLILAPGGTPRRLPIPGADAPNVLTFRGIKDAQAVDAGAFLLPIVPYPLYAPIFAL